MHTDLNSPPDLMALLALQQAELIGSDSANGDVFGCSVAISGDTALVGACSHDDDQGVAYVFVRSGTTWTQQAELSDPDDDPSGFAQSSYFGSSVALDGDTALVGAPFYSTNSGAGNQGAVEVFVRSATTWTQQAVLVAGDGSNNDEFGSSVALSGGTALIGAPDKTDGSNAEQGAAYVFAQTGSSTWTMQGELTVAAGVAGERFGSSVALDGDTALVGMSWDSTYVPTIPGAAWRIRALRHELEPAGRADRLRCCRG